MSSTMSKRQQARNEKTLHELVNTVPGNNLCADCHARNPPWASWSLGVFLCMRCAAIHRKLGTHISKVKSLSMDSWTNEQVDNMRKVGNVTSNQIYNVEGRKAPVPVDADEADSVMERFIRQKYMNNVASAPGKPQSPRADEGTPPPLPPKNSSKFGLRSASSIFPLSSRAKKEAKQAAAMESHRQAFQAQSPQKPEKAFGVSVSYDTPEDTEKKAARLRDMGFHDVQRNAMVLKGVNGNIERAVETLVRLGEGDRRSPAPPSTATGGSFHTTRSSSTPQTPISPGPSFGLGLQRTAHDQPATPSSVSTNPFDMMPPAQPQTAQSTGTLHTNNPYGGNMATKSLNPYGTAQQPNDALTQAFRGLDISPQQPLFPHHTGGAPQPQQPQQQAFYQPHMPPSAPTSPQMQQPMTFQHSMTYPQAAPSPQTGYNPFLQTPTSPMAQQQWPPQSPGLNNAQAGQGNMSYNPFMRPPGGVASPSLGQIPEQGQTMFQNPQSLLNSPVAPTNPFYAASPSASPWQSPMPMARSPQTQQQFYLPQRPDKASIMALYGQGQTFSQQPQPTDGYQGAQTPTIPENQAMQSQQFQAPQSQPLSPVMPQPARSATLPMMSSNNPFMASSAAAAAGPGPGASHVSSAVAETNPFASNRQISRESMHLGMDLAWTNGRHSPDAFASLSARHA